MPAQEPTLHHMESIFEAIGVGFQDLHHRSVFSDVEVSAPPTDALRPDRFNRGTVVIDGSKYAISVFVPGDPMQIDWDVGPDSGTEQLVLMLEKAGKQFRYYEQQHRLKQTPEGNQKAQVNGDLAGQIEHLVQQSRAGFP
jgi:hypothetical protein